jgi:hypothetical protein
MNAPIAPGPPLDHFTLPRARSSSAVIWSTVSANEGIAPASVDALTAAGLSWLPR